RPARAAAARSCPRTMTTPPATISGAPQPFGGELLRPADPGYDDARRIHNGMIDKRPGLIARCRSSADVAAVVVFARDGGHELSVRGGGHNVAGRAVTEGGVMLDLSAMRAVAVDPAARTARAQGGARWGDVDRETQRHGLAVTGGMISTTGIGGLTLGGGLGWLMGRYGLTVDNLLSAEVVTADGAVVTASASEHEDLFWALRGGGGNFGVVTSFEYRLHPVGPVVTGFRVVYPFSRAAEVLRAYRDFTASIPDELTLNAALLHASDGSGVKLAGIVGFHVGPAEDVLACPIEYTTLNSLLDAAYPRGALNYWKSSFLDSFSDEAIAVMVDEFAACPSPSSAFVIENPHGEATSVPVEATAVPFRAPGYNFLITSVWRDAAASEANVAWTRRAFEAVRPFAADRCYVNYLAGDEAAGGGRDPVRAAYGPNYERLVAVKRRYDPANLFRLNQNIRP